MEIERYQSRFERLIELEQDEEMRRHVREIRRLSGRERERKGRCLLDLTITGSEPSIRGGREVSFARADGSSLPDLEISVGDLVQLCRKEPLADGNPRGTVTSKTNRSVTVSFPGSVPNWAQGRDLRLDQFVDNVTYRRMLDALFLLPGLSRDRVPLREVLLNRREPASGTVPESMDWVNPELNEPQKEAVRKAVAAEELHLIHGPPGTGKTVTLTEVVAQGVRRDRTVLATAPSNVAVDNLTESVVDAGLDAVRIGHPARTHPKLRDHTLDERLRERPAFEESERKRREALDLIEERRDLTPPSGQWRRGLSDEEIHHLADQGRGSRGVSGERMRQMSEYMKVSERIDDLFEESDRLEDRAIRRLLDEVDVVCCTNTGAGSDLLAEFSFDWVCVDEATQSTEPSTLIPTTKGRKLIMAGDHRQLPPTVLSEEAREDGLDRSLFERMTEEHDDTIRSRLVLQYRMHRDIMSFSNDQFYEGSMKASPSVANHTLEDLPSYHPESVDSPLRDLLRARPPVTALDTSALPGSEGSHEDSHSYFNRTEGLIVRALVEGFVDAGLGESNLAVISPYKAQVEQLRDRLDVPSVEIDTVDGFQGREKEVVLISLVRSNDSGAIGFLSDWRRLNVALTRARRKLLVLGDASTLTRARLYANLFEHVEECGRIRSLDPSTLEDLENSRTT